MHFDEYAEPMDGQSIALLSACAKECNIYIIGGSIPERKDSQLFNTCCVFNPMGEIIATHRKLHLFDIDIPGKITFSESTVLNAGDQITVFDTKWGKMGVGICYDLRFPEVAMISARKHNVIAMIYPGAFNMTTGPLHWELLLRSRAIDNQIFTMACSPARDVEAGYVAWGHSTVVDPMGRVIATTEHDEIILMANLDLKMIQETRENIPISKQRRFDVYPDVGK